MTAAPPVRRYVSEAIGTAMLVAIGPGAAVVAERTGAFGHTSVALAFGLVVTIAVAAFGLTSGAHINPAVTLAFWSVRRFPGRDVVPYIAAQCTGAILAAFALHWTLGLTNAAATVPALPLPQSFAVEAAYSAILALVILLVATDERVPASVPPFAIGATVFAGALVTGPLTGGSFNPARSLGPAVSSGIWEAHWLYWLAPVAGMLAAAAAHEWLRRGWPAETVAQGVTMGVEGPIESATGSPARG